MIHRSYKNMFDKCCENVENRQAETKHEQSIAIVASHRLFPKKNIFLSVIGPTQLYLLSVLSITCLSFYTFKVNNKPKYPAGPRTNNHSFMPVLHKICQSGPVGPTISEKSVIV